MVHTTASKLKKKSRNDEIVKLYKKSIKQAESKTQLIRNIGCEIGVCEDTVRRTLKTANLL